ncbi:DsrE family protein [Magnetovirga frankeli]|uniref:DsrE family protein n=1 Tax=Magnetovirga frankeli TaxID=947516 RepID=UPI0012937A4C|nr:DsrE family protein [gamma proteobacterium SS-5]
MKLGLIIYSNDPETVWNAFRLGVFALQQGDGVRAFLLAKGVEAEQLDTEQFGVTAQIQEFVDKGGEILACGTCLKIRQQGASEHCPLSSMADLHELVRDSEKVLTF